MPESVCAQTSTGLFVGSLAWEMQRFFAAQRRWEQYDRFARPGQDRAEHHVFGRRVEGMAARLVAERGWPVSTTPHKATFDLWAGGARLEVKAAHWDGERYQAHIRDGQAQRCDLLLLACCAGDWVRCWFVIPAGELGTLANLAIKNADPRRYAGRWAAYRDRWDLVDDRARAGGHPLQLEMGL